ncbi:uncharacterized protein LOC110111872 [Dendrobium catenatum]|uniref:uncharacterized protein LOC110111872 n=1 Tax=Dendrobium catenatum TaxID=906689 RepID=UPI0009F38BD4|nr:uncharacterized protein LOC110111872 [Dendrobium catenatum]
MADLAKVNPWSNKPYIKLNFNENDVVLSEDGKAVRLFEEMEEMNSKKLSKSLVIKVFGRNLPSHMVAWELRRQWNKFGQFHFTTLGKGWFLCSFSSEEMTKAAHSGGPWFINGHIIGMEKWTPKFSTESNKGLSSPIWIRMPHLPLQCWDEKNVACIASRIGKPLMLDGNIFHWGRREFSRICVRISLDQPLPLGVWVDSISGRFFQLMEYEKVSNFCFGCGKIGHLENECELKNNNPKVMKVSVDNSSRNDMGKTQEVIKEPNYGPWIMVNNKKRRNYKTRSKTINSNSTIFVKKASNPVSVEQEDHDIMKNDFDKSSK